MTDEKLNKIETTLAHHDQQIQDLSEIINQQWKEIDRLKLRLEMTQAKFADLENGQGERKELSVSEQAAADKPPHY
jgi:SlyX protein